MTEMNVNQHGRRVRAAILALGLVLTAGAAIARAQTTTTTATATLNGVVTDESHGAVAAATITVFATETGFQRETKTDGDGQFTFAGLEPGRYAVRARCPGFKPVDTPDVVLKANERVTLQLELKVDSVGESVVVTAEKRGIERLQEVPVPVTVVDTQTLADSGKDLLKDYYTSVPGLSLSPSILGQTNLAIRGITTSGFTSPTVGIVVDDVPFGSSDSIDVPDFDPGDLARVEVLRGPQGTLYGASSMGGLIKFVTKDPTFDAVSSRFEVSTDSVSHGSEPGYNVRGSGNIPLNSQLATRVSGFYRHDAGYIDSVSTGTRGINKAEAYGGRFSLLWVPSPKMSLLVKGLYQRSKTDGSSDAEIMPGLGDLQQDLLKNAGGYDRVVQAYSATLTYKLPNVDLVSVTGFNLIRTANTFDATASQGDLTQFGDGADFHGFGVSGTLYNNQFNNNKYTQEVRASTRIRAFDLLFGGYAARETDPGMQTVVTAEDNVTGQTVGIAAITKYDGEHSKLDEFAGFVNATWHLSDRFDVQIGGRQSQYQGVSAPITATGPFVPALYGTPEPNISPRLTPQGHAFTYLFTPRLRVTPDVMVYGRLASGYRRGSTNTPDRVAEGAPANVRPDETSTYEVGAKAGLLHQRLLLDASLYYIDWRDIQITLLTPYGSSYETNGSGAKSEGAELSGTVRPFAGLTASAWVEYDNAVLTKDFVNSPSYGKAGDRLPLSSRVSGNVSAEQDFPTWKDAQWFVAGQVSYVGSRLGQFQSTPTRQYYPSYARTDLSLGLKNGTWQAGIYFNNLGNSRGILNGGANDLYNPYAVIYIQPRTVRFTFSRRF